MSGYNIDRKPKVGADEQKQPFRLDRSLPSRGASPVKEMGKHPVIGETFHPDRDRHLSVLNAARTANETADILADIQRAYGNQYVQSLVESISIPGSPVCALAPVVEEEELLQGSMAFEKEEELVGTKAEMEEEELQFSPAKKQPVMVPVDPSRCAGCVIVRNGSFDIFISDSTPDVVLGGVMAHENKHVEDFENDPDYMTIPTQGPSWGDGPIPDGETFYYRNWDDARRFEHPAIDIEIAWLEEALEQDLEPEEREIAQHRKDVVLPAYRASFG